MFGVDSIGLVIGGLLAGVACRCAAGAAAEIYSPDDSGQQLTSATSLVRPRHDSNQY